MIALFFDKKGRDGVLDHFLHIRVSLIIINHILFNATIIA